MPGHEVLKRLLTKFEKRAPERSGMQQREVGVVKK